MTRGFLRCTTVALIAAVTPSILAAQSDAEALDAMKKRFEGHYELLSYVSFRANGEEVDMNYEGRIMYDAHGNMSAIGMPRDLPQRAAQSDRNVQAGFAYWASVSWDLDNGIVIHHVEGSPTRGSWPGVDNVRYFEWTDDGLLKLSLKNDEGRIAGTLTWKKIEE